MTIPVRKRLPANVYDTTCESRRVLDVIMNKWALLILLLLSHGTMRYNEMRRELSDISHKMLTQTLRALEAEHFISRTVYPVVPPHVDYALTPEGERLITCMQGLVNTIEAHVNAKERSIENSADSASDA
jgi:DNA-binding HxlR family transcriptional regulator